MNAFAALRAAGERIDAALENVPQKTHSDIEDAVRGILSALGAIGILVALFFRT